MATKDNIKKLRKRYGLTQQKLADIAGVTNKAVSAWEKGLSEPRMGAIERISNHFGIKKGDIIDEGGMDNLEIDTIAAHHDGDEWTEEELEEIEKFKEFVRSKRKQQE